ncbi:MAG: hypothetical protein ACYTBS_01200 [Planctomycetota bacterium]
MNKKHDAVAFAASLIFKAVVVAAEWSGRVRKRSPKKTPCGYGLRYKRQKNALPKRQGLPTRNAGVDSPRANQEAAEEAPLHHPRKVVYSLAFGNLSDTKSSSMWLLLCSPSS